jgi:hypothetical protein
MKKIILFIVSGMLLLGTDARSEEIFLKCGTWETSNYQYINTTKKLVGEAYLQKNKRDLFVYDWLHEEVKITDKEIEYKDLMTFAWGYYPKKKNYNKVTIDRYSGRMKFYNKDPNIFDNLLPNFFNKLIDPWSYAWIFQSWKEGKEVVFCENFNAKNLNLIFKSRKDYEYEKETQDQYLKNKPRKF